MQAIEFYQDGVQISEIGQEDVFSMDDFERETNFCGQSNHQLVNHLAQFNDPYAGSGDGR